MHFSQRTTLAPLIGLVIGRSLYDRIQPLYVFQITFAGWADGMKFFFKFGIRVQISLTLWLGSVQAVMCHHGAFLRKSFGILSPLPKRLLGTKQRKIGILVPCVLKHLVQGVAYMSHSETHKV